MRNLMEFKYAQSGASSNTNDMGMRAMHLGKKKKGKLGGKKNKTKVKTPPSAKKERRNVSQGKISYATISHMDKTP